MDRHAVEHGREPCPDRIVDDAGGAFGMGAVGGGLYHAWAGARNSPQGAAMRGALEVRALPPAPLSVAASRPRPRAPAPRHRPRARRRRPR